MSWTYPFLERIRLHVPGRISPEDAHRQEATAREILRRLEQQPGVVLADEVGMGKTFVALAVAVSVAQSDARHRPVVVMVPPSLKEKWPQDFALFREKCLPDCEQEIRCSSADRAVAFLKLLDDPPGRRKSVVFLTHGAMSRGLKDGWVKLAVIYRALYRKHNIHRLRRALCRCMGDLLWMNWVDRRNPDIWERLLNETPGSWLEVLQRCGIDPEGDDNPDTDDDPVPQAVLDVLWDFDTGEVYDALQQIPLRQSKHYAHHVAHARHAIVGAIKDLWRQSVSRLRIKLPLLVMDEAHHLKNARTQLASLFHVPDAEADAAELKGALGSAFERMLFLTATPFQLGHSELCSVLDRFGGITWHGKSAPEMGREGFGQRISDLQIKLDAAQEAAVCLDSEWGRLRPEDLLDANGRQTLVEEWWQKVRTGNGDSPRTAGVLAAYQRSKQRMLEAGQALRPWVIRHLKPRALGADFEHRPRREQLVGQAILSDTVEPRAEGLALSSESLLPFLLAARATVCSPENRPVFAEGLASSYEAFLHTRSQATGTDGMTDGDDEGAQLVAMTHAARWYLERLAQLLPLRDHRSSASHPKIAATLHRVLAAWKQGEKVVVFCHFVATGRALRRALSNAVREEIRQSAARMLRCPAQEAEEALERIGRRFFDTDSPVRSACDAETATILHGFPGLHDHVAELTELVRRNVRTPSFLVRYLPLDQGTFDASSVEQAFGKADESGMSLRTALDGFFDFLQNRCGAEDRRRYIEASGRIQTGSILEKEVRETFFEDETQDGPDDLLVPNVRLINGATKQDTRQRLMLTFNTPFFPEILVASSVMAEGVDLHRCCRYVVHHDLCWNPSTLEQRTGRVDRIGAKVELCGHPVRVYLPYIAETQDEKMYRVIMDRARWFSVVMGEKFKVDARTTEKLAARIPLPESLARELAFRLEVACE